jgi:hypothetical protein
MATWLLITGADITPGSTMVFRGLGRVTPDNHCDENEHCLREPPNYIATLTSANGKWLHSFQPANGQTTQPAVNAIL